MTNNWNKFSLLMWKNWRIQWNHKKQLVIEIVLPILFAGLLIVVRSLVDPKTFSNATTFPAQNITFSASVNITAGSIKRYEVAYYPKSKCLEDVADYVQKWLTENNDLSKQVPFFVTGHDNVTELDQLVKTNGIIAGVQFDDSLKNSEECPKKISYAIRFPSELRQNNDMFGNQIHNWETNNLFPVMDFGGPRIGAYNYFDANPSYYREGFIGIQHAFALGFIEKLKKNNEELPEINIQRFPYPPYVFDPILTGLESMVSFIILISFVYPCSQTVKYVTTEKEKQLKEVMKIMGLPNWLHWTAWFLKTYPLALISVTLMVILFKVHWTNPDVSVLSHCDWSILLVFLYIYCISMVTFCFMVATFFSKANTASAVSGLLWFIWFLPYQFTDKSYSNMVLSEKLGLSLFSNTAMGYGFKLILKLEGTGEGLQWDNLFRPVNIDDDISVGLLLIMLIVDSVVYMLIALYVEKILPGSFGVPEKWYFPFTKSYWCSNSYSDTSQDTISTIRSDPAAFEIEPKNKRVGLSIKNLHKDFGDKIAVNQLTMDLYEDEITVLLGHNGAGKTTTISMLTGMIPPSQGTAVLNGYDIRTNLMKARMSLGLCPQHNILFDELTVREHIIFYSRLKGLKETEVESEVEKYVKLLELENKVDTQSKKLSGGMKRKLSVAAALCGGSKVVLCDEPTSGMDPSARRALWDLLELERKGRTILLSTHFMDEADVLGDRIAIMCSGELKAYGTSFFLKKRYGAGYHLICVKKDDCKPSQITDLLRKFIPDIVIESDIGTELTYQLPDTFSKCFEKMLQELEEHSEGLQLSGYGISNTTLEEVFMLVGSDRQDQKVNGVNCANGTEITGAQNKYVHLESSSSSTSSLDRIYLLNGIKLTLSQWKAMLLKKYLYTIRNYIILIIQNFMPVFFVIITVLIFKTFDPFNELKALKLEISEYSKTVTALEPKDLPKDSLEDAIVTQYQTYIEKFGSQHKFIKVKDFENYLIDLGKKSLKTLNSDYIIGGVVAPKNITAAFNAQLLHVLPVTLNAIHNAVLRATTDDSSYTIEVTNHPLPYAETTKLKATNMVNFGYQLSINLSFAMSFVISFYLLFQIKERVSRAKLLQFVSGVKVITFWSTQFLADYATYLVTAIMTIITIACFQEEGFATFEELGRAFLVFMLFGLSSLPLTYLWAFCFTDSATGYTRVSIFNVFTGMALSILVFILNMFVEKNIVEAINAVALIFPNYVLAKSLESVHKISRTKTACLKICDYFPQIPPEQCTMENLCRFPLTKECCVPDYFDWKEPGIGSHIVYTFVVAGILFAILTCKELRLIDGITFYIKSYFFEKYYKPSDTVNPVSAETDEDVKEEKLRVARMSPDEVRNTNLVVDCITKYYWKFLAVNNISVAVEHSECFGLLGVNGAGKTTTFKMMTGDERISYGEAYVKGLSVKTKMNDVYQEIGYCPQFDALLEDLTGRETLRIFALLRGIPGNLIQQISEDLAKGFGFMKHFDKPVKTYSGGNKRKLSASLALIGNPSVVYLDEPTTGMDPGAKRQLWNKVCQIRDSGKSIILTSHSMEECEALCTRLAIMVNGEFKCIGSTQHLKNRFSKGLILKIKIHRDENGEHNPRLSTQFMRSLSQLSHNRTSIVSDSLINEEVEKITRFVKEHFSESELKEQHQGLLTFYIPLLGIQWSKIFGIMEANKSILKIEDYSISQTTLEEIFLEFAKYQHHDNRVGQ
ncbi:phospholipid-transporting ATPase ABCA3-like [Condylostylus longicornis]|uniref:phospholipid-transporting ATPase ABCA3-like n=1 Tax=Condylostylus longicornis TaxID=2530218 RepID=UPI00244DBDA3|nr:phospholipid-transporting ATPase ABCA3-like [Condylostylus longicornis]XP_055389642.1 phospholipid-transporting ATPase ABCA3-like [Condylostylus longicornis]XP_055389643.1 phospholipid-transporting ATPase ABCA3-like [Condylostylus longicornis]